MILPRLTAPLALTASLASAALAAPPPIPPEAARRADELLARMTLAEKVGQLVQVASDLSAEKRPALLERARRGEIGSLLTATDPASIAELQRAARSSRLGIPLLFGYDVIHGFRTITPIPLAEAAAFDPELAARAAAMAAREAAAAGIDWSFAPMVDIARDARWGRIAEGAGEDVYLATLLAAARVRGFQSVPGFAACAKHFVGYGAAEAGRDYAWVDVSERTLREVYLPPFRAAVDAGALTLMSAFNDLSGVPASANPFTLTTILRDEWGFPGFVVSDWGSVAELVKHGFAADPAEAAQRAITAGVDMEMEGGSYGGHLVRLVETGVVPQAVVDRAVRRVLAVKLALGLFDKPLPAPDAARRAWLTPDHLALAREAARRAIVLLGNRDGVLPLSRSLARVALIGPLADSREEMLGTWAPSGKAEDAVTLLEGLRAAAPHTAFTVARGCGFGAPDATADDDGAIVEAVRVAAAADLVILAVGESHRQSGEAASRAELGLPGRQQELVERVLATGKPAVVVLMNGRPLAVPWLAEHAPALVEAWHLGVQAGPAIAEVLFGDHAPTGRLPVSFPRATGQVPIYYARRSGGRPPVADDKWNSKYLDVHWTPLYPFGYGLTYTTFAYSNLQVSPARAAIGGDLSVAVDVSNTGSRPGEELVQLYVRDVAATVTRPERELKRFARVRLAPGERRTVTFTLPTRELAFLGADLAPVVEPGEFQVWAAPDARSGPTAGFTLVQAEPPR